jgi:uncharacterized protein
MMAMSRKQELEIALKEAMRAQDDLRKRVIRMALAAIRFAEVEKGGNLEDSEVLVVLQKELKARQETIAEAQKAGRTDMIAANEADIGVLRTFLPQPLTPEELEALVRATIAETGAASLAEMGKVMKALTPQLEGRATGFEASQMVRQVLQKG